MEDSKKKAILDKYGSQAQPSLDPRLRLGQSEAFVEYSRDGRVLKGVDKAPTRTKYEEDVYVNNHLSVWGSYYSRLRRQWGYCCCHSLMRNSYCTGEKGREANDAANGMYVCLDQSINQHIYLHLHAINTYNEHTLSTLSQPTPLSTPSKPTLPTFHPTLSTHFLNALSLLLLGQNVDVYHPINTLSTPYQHPLNHPSQPTTVRSKCGCLSSPKDAGQQDDTANGTR